MQVNEMMKGHKLFILYKLFMKLRVCYQIDPTVKLVLLQETINTV